MVVSKDMCILCGKPIIGNPILATINGKEYFFDREECALTFKKLKSVYGSDFCVNFNT
jgi:YHS domain-containing protein